MNSRRVWTEEQDKAISELVKQQGTKNWASVATQLSKRLREKPRSGKQCRERWHNHLNPTIEKKGWSTEEEKRLFGLHKCHGNKWTVIAEQLPGRTDNSIKNYFYSTIRRSLRRMGKFVGNKNSTEQMKTIKPSTLSKIFAAGSELSVGQGTKEEQAQLINYIKQKCESVRDEIIQFTNYKPKRNDKANHAEQDRYQKVIVEMIHINQVYEKIKGEEKKRRHEDERFKGSYRLTPSSESEEPSEEEEGELDWIQKKTPVRSTRETKEQTNSLSVTEMEMQATTNAKAETINEQSQPNLDHHESDEESDEGSYKNPCFQIELKEEQKMLHSNFNPIVPSPVYNTNTPSSPFSRFSLTPKSTSTCFNSIQGLGILQNNAIDQQQLSIQLQIQNNNSGNSRMATPSISLIGSPGSRFRQYGSRP